MCDFCDNINACDNAHERAHAIERRDEYAQYIRECCDVFVEIHNDTFYNENVQHTYYTLLRAIDNRDDALCRVIRDAIDNNDASQNTQSKIDDMCDTFINHMYQFDNDDD